MTIPAPIEIRFEAGTHESSDESKAPRRWIEGLKCAEEGPGIYAFILRGKPVHVSWSANLARRLRRLFRSSYTSSEGIAGNLIEQFDSVQCWPTGSRLETQLLMYELLRTQSGGDAKLSNYRKRMRLRMPWYLVLTARDPFPLLVVTNRPGGDRDLSLGPFIHREQAQRYEQEVLGLFQIRRCNEALQPSPDHPGCIYGEINACLRPCQAAVSREEYATEAVRVGEFLSNNGRHALTTLSIARDRACEARDFEQASELHKRVERLKSAAQLRDPVVTDVSQFRGVALTRAASGREVRLWPMWDGLWQQPLGLSFLEEDTSTLLKPVASIDRMLREKLGSALSEPVTGLPADDSLALFSRWYHSSARVSGNDGVWFPFRTLVDLNYRGLVREISKLLKSAPPTESPTQKRSC